MAKNTDWIFAQHKTYDRSVQWSEIQTITYCIGIT